MIRDRDQGGQPPRYDLRLDTTRGNEETPLGASGYGMAPSMTDASGILERKASLRGEGAGNM